MNDEQNDDGMVESQSQESNQDVEQYGIDSETADGTAVDTEKAKADAKAEAKKHIEETSIDSYKKKFDAHTIAKMDIPEWVRRKLFPEDFAKPKVEAQEFNPEQISDIVRETLKIENYKNTLPNEYKIEFDNLLTKGMSKSDAVEFTNKLLALDISAKSEQEINQNRVNSALPPSSKGGLKEATTIDKNNLTEMDAEFWNQSQEFRDKYNERMTTKSMNL